MAKAHEDTWATHPGPCPTRQAGEELPSIAVTVPVECRNLSSSLGLDLSEVKFD